MCMGLIRVGNWSFLHQQSEAAPRTVAPVPHLHYCLLQVPNVLLPTGTPPQTEEQQLCSQVDAQFAHCMG